MWSAKFGKNKFEYGSILREMHTSLYEEVGSKYGLERGDSVDGRNVQHLNKCNYICELSKEQRRVEKEIKGLKTIKFNLEIELSDLSQDLKNLEVRLEKGEVALCDYQDEKAMIEEWIHDRQRKIEDKESKLLLKEKELDLLLKDISNVHSADQPFKNYKLEFEPSRLTEKPPMFGVDGWMEKQNSVLGKKFMSLGRQMEDLYRKQAKRYVEIIRKNLLVNMKNFVI